MGQTDRPVAPASMTPPSAVRSGVEGFIDDLSRTEEGHFRGRSLPYVRALRILRRILAGDESADEIVSRLAHVWSTRTFHVYYERPFLILAALRAEAMASPSHPLARAFATDNPDPLAVTPEALVEAMSSARTGLWVSLASRFPQTNEVSRAVVWRWPAELGGAGAAARPLALVDVGASGGLNLISDLLPGGWEDATGGSLRVASAPHVCLRLGFDVHPLDFHGDGDVAWARACLWAGASERVRRFDQAVDVWRGSAGLEAPPTLEALNASLVPTRLPAVFAQVPANGLLFVYQTVLRGYMETSRRDRYDEGMRRWLATLPRGRVAWLEAETTDQPAALVLNAHLPDGAGSVRTLELATTTVHPRLVEIRAHAAAEFAAYFRRDRA